MYTYAPLAKNYADTCLIGVTGHIRIKNKDKLKAQVKQLLLEIQAKHEKVMLLCPGARGADQLVAAVAFELDIPVLGIRIFNETVPRKVKKAFKWNRKWFKINAENAGFTLANLSNGTFEKKLLTDMKHLNLKHRHATVDARILEIHTAVSAVIAGNSDYIIALWDGVDNGKPGGTSETVHMALHGKDFRGKPIYISGRKKGMIDKDELFAFRKTYKTPKGILYQIVTPRNVNRFPIGRFPISQLQPIPHAGIYECGATLFPIIPAKGNLWLRFRKVQRRGPFRTFILLNYYLPIFLALYTVCAGSIGFRTLRHYRDWKAKDNAQKDVRLKKVFDIDAIDQGALQANDFFSAVNLITFDASADIDQEVAFCELETARWAGLSFILTAFVIGIFIAIGKNNKIRFKIGYWNALGLHYDVVAGLNDKSFHLAVDLVNHGKRVILIDGAPDLNQASEVEKHGVNVYIGNSYSILSLKKIHANKAKRVYLMHEDDTINIRTLHELEQLSSIKPVYTSLQKPKLAWDDLMRTISFRIPGKQHRYIHITDARYKDFVCKSHPDAADSQVHVFNIYENTARRLMIQYPIHRFDLEKQGQTAEVFVFGFGEMAEQIVLNSLRSGFYDEGRRLKITVFTSNHEDKRTDFYKKYPALWHDTVNNSVYEKLHTQTIRDQIFPSDTITFKELPLSDGAYFNDDTLDQAILGGNVVSLYFCTPSSLQSAAYLHAILPKIQHLQESPASAKILTDVQCFCHYNLYDKEEVAYVEHILNSRIPNSPVIFFGSFINECTEQAFSDKSDDLLPKLINLWYSLDRSLNNDGRRKSPDLLLSERDEFWFKRSFLHRYMETDLAEDAKCRWSKLSITQKESNRYAADHIWTKLYLLGYTYQQLSRGLEITDGFAEIAQQFIYVPEEAGQRKILEMAITEHRRWCAEKLLDGFLPAQDYHPEIFADGAYKNTLKEWNSYKHFKDYYQEQKKHIDLVPYASLYSEEIDGNHYDEKVKDIALIEAIPYLIDQAFERSE